LFSYNSAMTVDDTIIPEHNMVSSEWEKKQVIRSAYDVARVKAIPQLIDVLQKHFADNVWVAATHIFHSQSKISQLWAKPDYLAVHDATLSFSKIDDPKGNANTLNSASTQLFLGRKEKQIDCIGAVGKNKIPKGFPDKCLLRHEFSKGSDWLMVCKLRRRHQKEIAKHPSFLSPLSPSKPAESLPILDELTRSAIIKYSNVSSKNRYGSFNETQHKFKSNHKESETDVTKDSGKETPVDAIGSGVDLHQPSQFEKQVSILQEETNKIIKDALSIVRAAENLEIGEVPKTTVVRWKTEDEFEIRYFS